MSDDAHGDGPADPGFVDTTCPRCGERMRPVMLRSGSLVLRCRSCGQVALV